MTKALSKTNLYKKLFVLFLAILTAIPLQAAGETLKNKNLASLENKKNVFSFKELVEKENLVLVDLWASWCSPCIESLPKLSTFKRDFPGLKVVAISFDDEIEDAEKFLKEQKLSETHFYFAMDKKISQELKVEALPTVFLYSKGNRIKSFRGYNQNFLGELKNELAKTKKHENLK